MKARDVYRADLDGRPCKETNVRGEDIFLTNGDSP